MQAIKSDPEQPPAPLPTAVAYPTMKPKPLTKLVTKAADKPIGFRNSFEALTEELIVEGTRQGERKRRKP